MLVRGVEALVAAAEVGEVAAQFGQRPHLDGAVADRAGERECLLADRQRLVEAPRQHQPTGQRRQRLGARHRGFLGRHQLDHPLEGGEGGVGPAALVQVAAEAVVQARGAQWVAAFDELDGASGQLDGTRCRTGAAGELGRPSAEPGEIDRARGRRRRAPPATA